MKVGRLLMIATRLEYSLSFEFVLSDDQRRTVEQSMRHPGVNGVRWVKYPLKRFDTAMIELSVEWGRDAIAEAIAFVDRQARTFETLEPVASPS